MRPPAVRATHTWREYACVRRAISSTNPPMEGTSRCTSIVPLVIVAGTLAMASSHSALRQVIVTTYEAPIAQQLMEDVPSASLIYVTSAE